MRLALLFALSLLPSQLAVFAADRVLLIGIGAYRPEIGVLPGIDKDVALARDLALRMAFKPDQVRTLFNEQATLANIKQAFNTWLMEAGPRDRVFVYYSGHGAQVPDQNGDEQDRMDEMWVTFDTTFNAQGRLINYLLDDEVDSLVSSLKSERILLVVDSCHSGSAAKAIDRERAKDASYAAKQIPFIGEPKEIATIKAAPAGPVRWLSLSAAQDNEVAGASQHGSYLTTSLAEISRQLKGSGKPLQIALIKSELERSIVRHKPDQHPNIDGSTSLANADWFQGEGGGSSNAGALPPVRSGAQFSGELAGKLEGVYQQRSGIVPCALAGGATTLKERATVSLECDLPFGGYLYVFNLGAGEAEVATLFPNRWVTNTQVEQGALIIPSAKRNFIVRANLPAGVTSQAVRLYAVLTPHELKGVAGDFSAGFPPLTPEGARALGAEAPQGYYAARIEFTIVR